MFHAGNGRSESGEFDGPVIAGTGKKARSNEWKCGFQNFTHQM